MLGRDDRIDFFRGLALLLIFVDHVPSSLLSLFGLKSLAFADAAELFFFVSGLTAALVYAPFMNQAGFAAGAARIWRRAWGLYCAHMILFVFVVAGVAIAVALSGREGYFVFFRVEHFFSQTDATIVPALLLSYQPAYLDVLPVYVVFFLALPWICFAASRNIWFALVPSFLLYIAVQLWGWTFRTYPWDATWLFNPLAWQFLFVLGIAVGHGQPRLDGVFGRWATALAALFAAVAAIVQFSAALHSLVPEIPSLHAFALPVYKANLGWLRVVSFLALAIVVARLMPGRGVLQRSALCAPVVRCGRNSLAVFCLGTLLAIPAQVAWHDGGHSTLLQLLVSIAGVALLLGFARALDLLKVLDRSGSAALDRPRALLSPAASQ